jgi:hypothetical protein
MNSLGKVRATAVLALLCLSPLPAPGQEQTDPVGPGFNDPEFWRIVETGPANSEELELAVTTYAANDMPDRVVELFVRYFEEADLEEDPYCSFCMSLLPQTHGYEQSELAGWFFEATDRIVDRAMAEGSSDALIRLAVIAASSSVRVHRDLALYFLTAAAQAGIDDDARLVVVQTLANLGFPSPALAIAESIYADPESAYYESETVKQWIAFLANEIDRTEKIGGLIAAAATAR